MSSSIRRTVLVLLSSGALGCVALLQPALAQPGRPVRGPVIIGAQVINVGPELGDPTEVGQSIQLPTDNLLKKKLEAAQDYMKTEDWERAAQILQKLLDVEEDVFVPVKGKDPTGKEKSQWVSVRSEANRLLAAMPGEGLEHYRLSYGATAKDLLNQAKAANDPQLLAQVAERYLYTDAGAEATSLLGTYHLDRGRFTLAALYFERLIGREGIDKLPAATLVEAALAFHRLSARAGEEKSATEKYRQLEENAWKELTDRVGDRVRLGDRTVTVAELRGEVNSGKDAGAGFSRHDWAMYGGNASRSAVGSGDKPFMGERWSVSTIREDKTRELIDRAVHQCENHGQAVLPAFFPIAADGKLIYRSYGGIYAVELEEPHRLCWLTPSLWGLDNMLAKDAGAKQQYVSAVETQYLQQASKPSIFFENSTIGTLSTDNSQVYAVMDLAVPPSNLLFYGGFNPMPQVGNAQFAFPGVADALGQSELHAFNLKSGKLIWKVGVKHDRADNKDRKETADLSETFFLGPPLPMHGKLYVLTEKNQELRLVCLDAAHGDAVWVQLLANTQTKLAQDPSRRVHAAHLSYGEGILVCPTNAGMVLGVDLLSHSLVWAYDYREKGAPSGTQDQVFPRPPIAMPPGYGVATHNATEWKVTAPIIVEGKVVFTAPDGAGIYCVSLRDGTPVWSVNRSDDDLYLGGVLNGKVVVVGKTSCRALGLSDGKELWRVQTGMPSGQGVASDNMYYLPLKALPPLGEPAVAAIDVDKGVLFSQTRPRNKDVIPGNLLLYEGYVVSQTVDEVAIFKQLDVKIAQINQRISKNPQDPVGLTERGELRLAQGDRQGAVDDLRTALKNSPPPDTLAKARNQLYEALTEYLQHDFNTAEKYLDEYKGLCKVEADSSAAPAEKKAAEAEGRRRTADYLCLLAKGREDQGRLSDAFQRYLDFGALADGKDLLSVVGDRTVKAPADVWARGRISAMMARATPEQRAPLEKLLGRKWDELKHTSDTEALRQFVSMFASQFAVGREARLYLAEKLMEEPGNASLLEAERQLLLLRGQHDDRVMSGRALEALARLMARKGLLEDAAYYYRVLGRDYADLVIRDGKTGADFLNDLATDKRFLPYVDEPGLVSGGKFSAHEEHGAFNQTPQVFTFEHQGEALPFFQRQRVALEPNFHKFRLIDRDTNEVRWEKDLTRTNFQTFVYQGQPFNAARFPYQTVGHAIVLNLGQVVFGLDPINQEVLWEKNLVGGGPLPNFSQVIQDPKDGSLQIIYQDGWIQHLGQIGPVEASYVCLQTREGLVALDPITGRTLWTRSDVSPRTRVFGDDQYVYLVDMNPQGTPTSTRALRAYDGVWVEKVPDFTAAYQERQRIAGGRVLVSETVNANVVLRLYDIPTGKDLWKGEFPANSLVLHSEDADLGGVVEPNGKVTVLDLRTQKEVLKAALDPNHVAKAQGVALLTDRVHYYLAVNGPRNPNVNPWGGPWPNFLPGSGLRCLPVDGSVYAFFRDGGTLDWRAEVPMEMLVLDQFQDLPILLCTSRSQKMAALNGNRFQMNALSVHAFDKRTGKIFYRQEDAQNVQQFVSFSTDLREGRFELVSYTFKVVITHSADSAAADAGDKESRPAPAPVAPGNAKPLPAGGVPLPPLSR